MTAHQKGQKKKKIKQGTQLYTSQWKQNILVQKTGRLYIKGRLITIWPKYRRL